MDLAMQLRRELGLNAAEHSVHVSLAWHLNDVTRQCNPSASTIAGDTGLGRKRVLRALHTLQDKRVTEIAGAGQRSGRKSNQYRLIAIEPFLFCGATSTPQTEPRIGPRSGVDRADSGVVSTHSGATGAPELLNAERTRDQEQRRSRAATRSPEDSPRLLVRLAHGVFDDIAAGHIDRLDLAAELKQRAAQARVEYDAERIRKALDSAEAQRARRAS